MTSGVALGLERLKGGAPDDVASARAQFEQAAAQGEPEARRWLALMAAAGVGMPQDWTAALDHLAHAATLGSASGAGQLAALAGGSAVDEPWALRAKIDQAAWDAPPAKRVLNAQPRTVAIDNFLSRSMARWMIGLAQPRLGPALVYRGVSGEEASGRTNTASQFAFTDSDVVVLVTRRRIAAAIGVPVAALETSQVLHYATGEAFAPHFDWLDPADPAHARDIAAAGQRIVTFLIYLNDDFEGGETAFPRLGLSHRGSAGDGLYFGNLGGDGAPDPRTLHAGLAPSHGEKWVFSQWIRNLARV